MDFLECIAIFFQFSPKTSDQNFWKYFRSDPPKSLISCIGGQFTLLSLQSLRTPKKNSLKSNCALIDLNRKKYAPVCKFHEDFNSIWPLIKLPIFPGFYEIIWNQYWCVHELLGNLRTRVAGSIKYSFKKINKHYYNGASYIKVTGSTWKGADGGRKKCKQPPRDRMKPGPGTKTI